VSTALGTVPLGSVCNLVGGGTPSKANEKFYGGPIPWATVRDLHSDIIEKTEHTITTKGLVESASNIIAAGNVIIASRVGLGKVCIAGRDIAINQDLRGIIPKHPGEILPRFLFWWLKSVSTQIVRAGTGATVQGVTLPFLSALRFPKVSIKEQKKIVATLDASFAAIAMATAAAEKNLSNAREIFRGYVHELFSSAGAGWTDRRLETICENLDSKRRPVTKRDRVVGDVPYYGASGVVDYVRDFIFNEDLLLVSEDGANLLMRNYPIAFSITGKSWVNNHAHVLRFSSGDTQKIVEYYLNSISLKPYVNGMAQPKLNQAALNSIAIPLPPPSAERAIVGKISELEAAVLKLESIFEEKQTLLGDLSQSILKRIFVFGPSVAFSATDAAG